MSSSRAIWAAVSARCGIRSYTSWVANGVGLSTGKRWLPAQRPEKDEPMKRIAIAVACALLASSHVQGPNAQAHSRAEPSSQASSADWALYHRNPHGTHYSTLHQIN